MSAVEQNLPERVIKLESTMEAVVKGIDELKLEMREMRQEIRGVRQELLNGQEALRQEMRQDRAAFQQEIRGLRVEMNGWLKWMLGLVFSSWLTLMVSIWLKR